MATETTRESGHGTIYLLHFASPLGAAANPRGHARHYIGWTEDVAARIAAHRSGHGAAITAACVANDIAFDVVRTWEGDRYLERKLKNRKNAPGLCPACERGAL